MKLDKFMSTLEHCLEVPTAYALGTFGWCSRLKSRALNNPENATKFRKGIEELPSDGFMFDCVGLLKAICWGFSFTTSASYGGAAYKTNGLPDVNERGMLNYCDDVRDYDETDLHIGEYLYMPGHCGVYQGDGYAIECTPSYNGGVQLIPVHGRGWTKVGRLKWVEYPDAEVTLTVDEMHSIISRLSSVLRDLRAGVTDGDRVE